MRTTTVTRTEPFSVEQTACYVADFLRDGYLHVPDILGPGEVETLKEGIDNLFDDPQWRENGNVQGDFIALRVFETSSVFDGLIGREPVIGLMEQLLGADCHLIAENGMRNEPGQAIDSFHVDDSVIVPVGEGMERHDPRMPLPPFIINVMFPLTPLPSVEYGPTQIVPGSHYSGRHPNDVLNPVFEGRGPVSLLAKPGDMYCFNNQVWHRGAPNTSGQTRYVVGTVYGRRNMAQRFFPFMNYQMPARLVDGASERMRRVLGFHGTGAYG